MSGEFNFSESESPPVPNSVPSLGELPQEIPVSIAEQVHFFCEKAHQLIAETQFEAAITEYDHALDLQPDNYRLWYQRGLALRKLKRYEGAIANFDLALQLQPEYLPASRSRLYTLLITQRIWRQLWVGQQKLGNDVSNLFTAFVKTKLPTLVILALVSYASSHSRMTGWIVAGCFLLIMVVSDWIAESQR